MSRYVLVLWNSCLSPSSEVFRASILPKIILSSKERFDYRNQQKMAWHYWEKKICFSEDLFAHQHVYHSLRKVEIKSERIYYVPYVSVVSLYQSVSKLIWKRFKARPAQSSYVLFRKTSLWSSLWFENCLQDPLIHCRSWSSGQSEFLLTTLLYSFFNICWLDFENDKMTRLGREINCKILPDISRYCCKKSLNLNQSNTLWVISASFCER